MTPIDIYRKFLKVFPINEEEIDRFTTIDIDTIRVRLKNRKEFVFSYASSNKWRIDSVDLYKSEMKRVGRKK